MQQIHIFIGELEKKKKKEKKKRKERKYFTLLGHCG